MFLKSGIVNIVGDMIKIIFLKLKPRVGNPSIVGDWYCTLHKYDRAALALIIY